MTNTTEQERALREALASTWTDFLDANPDDLTSPEDLPDHALMTGQQFEEWAIEAFQRALSLPQQAATDEGEVSLKSVEARTLELMRKAAQREGIKLSNWVSVRLNRAAQEALSTPTSQHREPIEADREAGIIEMVERLEALQAKATPGPYRAHDHNNMDEPGKWIGYAWVGRVTENSGPRGAFDAGWANMDRRKDGCKGYRERASVDAHYIAEVLNALPALIAAARLSALPAAASVEAGERAQIVAWLRKYAFANDHQASYCRSGRAGETLRTLARRRREDATAIENGLHLTAKGKDQAC